MQTTLIPLNKILNSPVLCFQSILAKASLLKKINGIVQGFLQPILAEHCEVANLRDGCLVIFVQNAALATLLRYQLPDLLEKLRKEQELAGLSSIRSVVKPPAETNFSLPHLHNPKKPKKEIIELINQIALEITDQKLSKALAKLSLGLKSTG